MSTCRDRRGSQCSDGESPEVRAKAWRSDIVWQPPPMRRSWAGGSAFEGTSASPDGIPPSARLMDVGVDDGADFREDVVYGAAEARHAGHGRYRHQTGSQSVLHQVLTL